MTILCLGAARPRVHPRAFVAVGAIVVGDVELAADSSVWYSAVLRGDCGLVALGAGSNVQDGSVLHPGIDAPVLIGDHVSIGHRAVVHGCRVGDGTLIGMGALVLTGAEVGAGTVVAAGSVVTEGTTIPSGVLAMGAPAKVRRELSDTERAQLLENAATYAALADAHRDAEQLR
jgi:carbonic anhydrase/acetyltransferase-like protein (isoleucine patch superfamily)